MIFLLARLDDRASHAVGHMSVGQLHDLLVGFDAFLSTSDGLIPEASQRDPYGLWANLNQTSVPSCSSLECAFNRIGGR